MDRSSIPGAPGAGGGTLIGAAAPLPASQTIQWNGPFTPGELRLADRATLQQRADHAHNITMTQDEIQGITRSDPTWWVNLG